MITSEIIADSINPHDCRLTTFVLEYPRFIHSEIMTHRVFSRNAASSRAIPIEKMIQQIIDNPAMPEYWGKNQSGMQAKEELNNEIRKQYWVDHKIAYELFKDRIDRDYVIYGGPIKKQPYLLTDKEAALMEWLSCRNDNIEKVKNLNSLGLHKQISNRLLESWFNIRVILSSTEFENFFALREHPDAQPEFQKLANLMLNQYNESEPKSLRPGEWHIPFGDKMNEERLNILSEFFISEYDKKGIYDDILCKKIAINELKKKIAVARCARISYFNYEGKDDYEADIKLCDRLFGSVPRHLSPAEHVAEATNSSDFIGNFRGFKQYRKFFKDENLSDPRVIKKHYIKDADAPNYEKDNK